MSNSLLLLCFSHFLMEEQKPLGTPVLRTPCSGKIAYRGTMVERMSLGLVLLSGF